MFQPYLGPNIPSRASLAWLIRANYYMGMISQGLGTTEFTYLKLTKIQIDRIQYPFYRRFSHLVRHLRRLDFAMKNLQPKKQKY